MIQLLSALLITAGTPSAAQISSAAATAELAVTVTAADPAILLAATVLPEDMILADRVPEIEAEVLKEIAKDQQFTAFEHRHPGVREAVLAAARDEATTSYRMAIAMLRTDVAAIYRSHLSAAEMARALRFYVTRTGQALLLTSIRASGETASDWDAERRRLGAATFEHPDKQTQADFMILVEGGLAAKARAVAPEIAALSQRRFDDVSRLLAARLPKRIDAVIAIYAARPAS